MSPNSLKETLNSKLTRAYLVTSSLLTLVIGGVTYYKGILLLSF